MALGGREEGVGAYQREVNGVTTVGSAPETGWKKMEEGRKKRSRKKEKLGKRDWVRLTIPPEKSREIMLKG